MNKSHHLQPNDRLRNERLQRQWTQQTLADHIGATAITINRWERGVTAPSAFFRLRLCALFGKSAIELGFFPEERTSQIGQQQAPSSPLVYLPLRRNPLFTGRQIELAHLHHALHHTPGVAQAISGLGGMGKTQTALEYAYRYQHEHEAIFWLRAETFEVLHSDMIFLADVLQLYQPREQDQSHALAQMRAWLSQHTGWLLILDNIRQFDLLEKVLPIKVTGHILLTTRTQTTGIWVQKLVLHAMQEEEATLFLLRRAKLLVPNEHLEKVSEETIDAARMLTQTLDGLPLALDQAGAYIEETGCSLTDYLKTYQVRQGMLLQQRGTFPSNHPQSVATTFSLCLGQIAQTSTYAIKVLQFCAFLAPDAIPEELMTMGGPRLDPHLQSLAADPLAFDTALAVLRSASLLQRNVETRTLTLHRLLQACIKDTLNGEEQRAWVHCVLHALATVFPTIEQTAQWSLCEQLVPHVLVAFNQAEQWNIVSQETGQLFENAGAYLREHGRLAQAEPLLTKAQEILAQVAGSHHSTTIRSLHNLALLYWRQGRYDEAEPLFQRVLAYHEQHWDSTHPEARAILNDVAVLYLHQGRYEEAKPLFQRVLALWEQEESRGPEIACILNNLGLLFLNQGQYQEAAVLLHRAVALWEQQSHPQPNYWAHALNNLGMFYFSQCNYEEAESFHQRALLLRERHLGPMHPDTAMSLSNLASAYRQQASYEKAEPLYHRSLAIRQSHFGPTHLETAISLNGLATLYQQQGRYHKAEPLFQQALAIREQQLGSEHPDIVKCLVGLATLYERQQRYHEASPLLERSLIIRERFFGPDHPETLILAERHARLRERIGEGRQDFTGE